jgi:hypothetical protein
MKLSRPRFTVRRLMVVVALAALLLGVIAGVENRRRSFLSLVDAHRAGMIAWEEGDPSETSRERFDLSGRKVSLKDHRWHLQMAEKYERAARYPWLPVAPDPPAPE